MELDNIDIGLGVLLNTDHLPYKLLTKPTITPFKQPLDNKANKHKRTYLNLINKSLKLLSKQIITQWLITYKRCI